MERIKLTNKRSENAEKELRISDVLRSFYDYHWKRTDVVEKFYDYHWKNQIKIATNVFGLGDATKQSLVRSGGCAKPVL